MALSAADMRVSGRAQGEIMPSAGAAAVARGLWGRGQNTDHVIVTLERNDHFHQALSPVAKPCFWRRPRAWATTDVGLLAEVTGRLRLGK